MEKKVLFSRRQIGRRVRELGRTISADYQGQELIVIGVLKGSFIFMADLIRCLDIPCTVDFIRAASYGTECISSGDVAITKDLELDITGKDVLIVEDIIDTGITLQLVADKLKKRNPRSLKVCAFIDKRHRRQVDFEADYVGFRTEDGFLVGYGLDFNEMDRFLPDIYIVEI